MYTLNLKDIDLDPKIEESKSFEGATELEVVTAVVNYINESHKDIYNPYTLQRKCSEAVLHEGVSVAQESKQHLADLENKWETNAQQAVAEMQGDEAVYEEKSKSVYEKYDGLKAKLSETLENKAKELNLDTESEEYKKAQEEYQQGIESLEWEQDKELKALRKEISGTE